MDLPRTLRAAAAVALVAASAAPADAQLFGRLFGRGRNCCPPAYGYGPAAYGAAGYGAAGYQTAYAGSFQTASYGGPCEVAAAAAPVSTACACVQPVKQVVYKEVPVTKYRTVQKSVSVPTQVTAYEERDVTVYRTVNETKTATVPYTTYQTVSECRTAQVDNSRWQTSYVRNYKPAPCEYDPRPGFLGWMNRTGYEMRSAFTPNVVARRNYVRDVRTVAQPVTRQVPVTAYREVSYNVARVVPTVEKQRVAVLKTEMRTQTVAVQEPYTEMQTVAVGTTTQMAYVGGAGTATALAPTPASAQTAERPVSPKRDRTADSKPSTSFDPISTPAGDARPADRWSVDAGRRAATRRVTARPKADPEPAAQWTARRSPKVLRVAAWRSKDANPPALNVAAK